MIERRSGQPQEGIQLRTPVPDINVPLLNVPWEGEGLPIYRNDRLVVYQREQANSKGLLGEYQIHDTTLGLSNYRAKFKQEGEDMLIHDVTGWEYEAVPGYKDRTDGLLISAKAMGVDLLSNQMWQVSTTMSVHNYNLYLDGDGAESYKMSPANDEAHELAEFVRRQVVMIPGKNYNVSLYSPKR